MRRPQIQLKGERVVREKELVGQDA